VISLDVGDSADSERADASSQATGSQSFAVDSRIASQDPAVVVTDVAKRFRIYHERNSSLKASVMRGRRAEFEEFWAVDGVTFTVNRGETFGIVGENGSGKSTLLKCMARILRPDRGSIAVAGKVSALLELGAGFHQELSGRENVYLNGSILGLSKREIDNRFDDIVEFAGLERFIDTPVKNYSSGMYVRLGFSVAINVDPDVLLVDEVLSVGDENFQRRCAEKFTEMQREGKTIVVVSHALGSLRSMCDRLAWMRNGTLAGVGPTKDVIDEYLGTVNVSRLPGHDGVSKRWGNGDAEITGIHIIGPDSKPTDKVHTGDDITIRISYEVPKGSTIKRPGIGFGIHRLDGVLITGVNSHEQGLTPELIRGVGHFDYKVANLPLLTGTYDVSAALQDEFFTTTYDWWFEGFRFSVLPRIVHESEGVLTTFGSWSHHDAS
jgi:ABC-type polysaccharide/polyol phosphate transport system ATPase subunit